MSRSAARATYSCPIERQLRCLHLGPQRKQAYDCSDQDKKRGIDPAADQDRKHSHGDRCSDPAGYCSFRHGKRTGKKETDGDGREAALD